MSNKNFILGLDLGKASVGWAIVDCEEKNGKLTPSGVRAMNSRIFQEMVDAKTQVPKNQKRRQMRGARRRQNQYKRRRENLITLLQENKLLPEGAYNSQQANNIDRCFAERLVGKPFSEQWNYEEKIKASPYMMRAYALDNELTPEEFGRVLLNLQRRRGYFSNRGAKYIALREHLEQINSTEDKPSEEEEKDKEIGPVLKGIEGLKKQIKDGKIRTVGEYIWKQAVDSSYSAKRITGHRQGQGKEQINLYTTRQMMHNEFEQLWEKQTKYIELSDALKSHIEFLIFYQTPLEQSFQAKNKQEASMLGLSKFTPRKRPERANCTFELHKKRAAKAVLAHQEARTLQMINHITFKGQELASEQREKLYQQANAITNLNEKGRLTWTQVAKCLGGKSPREINFSRAGDDEGDSNTGLVGNRTAQSICRNTGEEFWNKLSIDEKEQLVTDLLTIKDKKALYLRLVNHWQLAKGPDSVAHRLAEAELETGYSKHSLRAWNKLLPYLRGGNNYHDACINAGYHHSYQKEKIKPREIKPNDVPQIANPIVQKALYEVRRVVNQIIKHHGHPAEIRVEMARDLANSKKHRKEIEKQQTINRRNNDIAEQELKKYIDSGNIPGLSYRTLSSHLKIIKPKDRKKYIMWKQEQNCKCPYCFKCISISELFGGAEIEHILPQVGFGQSYMNTVVACQQCNRSKGKKSPYEIWGGTKQWEDICDRISDGKKNSAKDQFPNLPPAKKKRIRTENFSPENPTDFVERDLKNTQYIAIATKNMLQLCGIEVKVSKGQATAILRRLWGINELLPQHPQESSYTETDGELQYSIEQAKQAKNRKDHRHHAIDALVTALTDHGILMRLTEHYQNSWEDREPGHQEFPLPGKLEDRYFTKDIKTLLKTTVVSHMRKDKVYGALHEESFYGAGIYYTTETIPCPVPRRVVNRMKKLIDTPSSAQGEAEWIEDENIKMSLEEWLSAKDCKQPPVHRISGKIINQIQVAKRCYIKRIPIENALDIAFNEVGKNRWVRDDVVREAIRTWKKQRQSKDIKQDLIESPPCMPSKSGIRGPEIKNVRVAYKFDNEDSIRRLDDNKYVQLGSYHHVEIFINENNERKGRFVSMLEAAHRVIHKKPLVNKQFDESGWKFEMDLKTNDLVRWENTEDLCGDFLSDKPIYRVQNMSSADNEVIFRHHTVSTVNDKHGKIRKKINQIRCKKITVDELGNISDANI